MYFVKDECVLYHGVKRWPACIFEVLVLSQKIFGAIGWFPPLRGLCVCVLCAAILLDGT